MLVLGTIGFLLGCSAYCSLYSEDFTDGRPCQGDGLGISAAVGLFSGLIVSKIIEYATTYTFTDNGDGTGVLAGEPVTITHHTYDLSGESNHNNDFD